MPEPPFDSLFRATATVVLPPAREIQSQAHRRVRRQVAGTVVACVGVAAMTGTTAWLSNRPPMTPDHVGVSIAAPDPSPSASASPRATPSGPTGAPSSPPPVTTSGPSTGSTGSARSALLRTTDLGPGAWTSGDEIGGDWGLTFVIQDCQPYSSFVAGIDTVERGHLDGATRSVSQSITTYRAGDSARAMAWVRKGVAACPTIREIRVRIISQGFAGDESFIVESTSAGSKRRLYTFVRVGNRCTEIVQEPPSESFARQLGQRAAARMRQ